MRASRVVPLAVACLLALPSFADNADDVGQAPSGMPKAGEGTIAILGGVRAILPGNGAYQDETGARHQVFQPGGLASFGYQYDEQLHFTIQLGYLIDSYAIAGGDLDAHVIPILFGLDTVLAHGASWTIYGGGGLGYCLNSANRQGKYNEANATAGYLALGFRIGIAPKLALVIEDRYLLDRAAVDPMSNQVLNLGGNLISVGLMLHFLEPDDHPPGLP